MNATGIENQQHTGLDQSGGELVKLVDEGGATKGIEAPRG